MRLVLEFLALEFECDWGKTEPKLTFEQTNGRKEITPIQKIKAITTPR